MLSLLLTCAAVIAISAACSLTEAVLYAITPAQIDQLEQSGSRAGRQLAALRAQVDRPITAILTVNTVANTAGATVSGALAARALGEGRVVLFSIALTVAILLFAEILPKTLGVVHARRIAPRIALPLTVTVTVLAPIIELIALITKLIPRADDQQVVSQEEILSLTRLGQRSGAIDEEEAAVIENVLKLPSIPVGEIMVERDGVFALDASMRLSDAVAMPSLLRHSRIPVVDDGPDDVIGMVLRRDLLTADDPEDPADALTIRDFVRPVVFVHRDEPSDFVLEELLDGRLNLVLVLDDAERFVGLVSLEDLFETLLGREIEDHLDDDLDLKALAAKRKAAVTQRRLHLSNDTRIRNLSPRS